MINVIVIVMYVQVQVFLGFLLLFTKVLILTKFSTTLAPFSNWLVCVETHPAEVSVTLTAFHMVTTLVFLYSFTAIRTRFCECLDPLDILRVCSFFKDPILYFLAFGWHMAFLFALEASS